MTSASAKRDGIPASLRPSRAVIQQVHGLTRERGRIAAIEPRSGEVFIADTLVAAVKLARREHPRGTFYLVRIGHRAAHWQRGGFRRVRR